MQTFDNVNDALDFVAAHINNCGNMVTGTNNTFYYIDCVVVIDNCIVVVAGNRFYTLCIKQGNFYIDREFDEASNDNQFWCQCVA